MSGTPESPAQWRPRLRRDTTLVLLAAFSALITALFVGGRLLYTDGFVEAEHRDLLARARHAQAVLSQGFAMLTPATTDYAEWEATRAFVQGTRTNYPDYNWQAWTLNRFNADSVFVMNLAGDILLQRSLDASGQGVTAPTRAETAAMSPQGPLWPRFDLRSVHSGYVTIAGRPYMWVVSPVHTDPDPPVGWLVLLRRLDGAFIRGLNKTLDADAQFGAPVSERMPLPSVPLQQAELRLEPSEGDVRSASFVVGMLPDGMPLRLRLSTERPLSATVARVSTYFFWASLVCGMVVALLAVRWVQRRLLAPLDIISRRLQEIGLTNDLSARLPDVGHRDEVTGVVTAANHLLEQIQSKREVELARDAALQASRAKSEFLARMSHEIRTPMNGVLGMTELMMSTSLDTRQRQIADTIQQSAQSLLGIINDTLDYSRIEAGKLAIDASPFDLAQIIDSAVDLMAERAAAKGLELLCELPADRNLRFIGDGPRLRQVLVNLLGNAVKFTERGEVQVRVSVEGPATPAGTQVRVEVIDTGIGIRLENQDSVFDSYSQEDTSTTRKYGGTGLGLAICRQVLGLMGGRIGVQSAPAQGSMFWFTLNLPADASAPATVPPNLKGQRVLLAVANPAARSSLRRQLRALQADDILEADARPAALSQLDIEAGAGRRLDIILVDLPGAEGDGIELTERARKHVLFAGSTIVLLTGIRMQIPEDRWRRAGASASLTKPLTHAAFLQIVAGFPDSGPAGGAGAQDTARADTDALSGLRVLVVEDNPVNQEVARGILEHLGCHVALAVDGEQGVRAATAARFDAILMDCHMPVMDGYVAARHIREWEAQQGAGRCIIIALTANALQGDRQKCLDAGMDDHLSKPFTTEQLQSMLLRHRPQARPPGVVTRTG